MLSGASRINSEVDTVRCVRCAVLRVMWFEVGKESVEAFVALRDKNEGEAGQGEG